MAAMVCARWVEPPPRYQQHHFRQPRPGHQQPRFQQIHRRPEQLLGPPQWAHDNSNADGRNLLNPAGLGDKVSEYVDWSQFLAADPTSAFQLPEIAVAPATLSFGNVALGSSATLSLTVSNAGSASLTVSSATSDNSQFKVLTSMPLVVSPGTAQTLMVRLAPIIIGSHSGTLTIASDDQARALISVSLHGNCGMASGLWGEFFQFKRSLGIMPNMIGIPPDYRGAFTVIEFPSTSQAFTSSDGIIPQTAQSNVFRDNFSARFTGSVNVLTNGNYLFTVSSDDGAMLKVNGQMVLDQNSVGSYRTASGAINLPAGAYPIELDYFQQGGVAGLDLAVSGPGPVSLTTNKTPTLIEVQVTDGFIVSTFAEGIGFPIGLAYSPTAALAIACW